MTDDIVRRLRVGSLVSAEYPSGRNPISQPTDLEAEAADEIERLRAQIEAQVASQKEAPMSRPRDIDHLAESHRLAEERRAADLPIWAYKVDIKTVLLQDSENQGPEHVVMLANKIAAILRAGLPAAWLDMDHVERDETLWMIVDDLESAGPSPTTVEELNDTLSDLYDWADHRRVWLGP